MESDRTLPARASTRVPTRRTRRARLLAPTAAGTAVALVLAGAGLGATSALAAPGDTSNAAGQYLSGSLLGLDTDLLVSLGGETAASDGQADVTNANTLDVGALGVVTLTAPGGIQIPLDLGGAGVVSQYASALSDAGSVGASGLTSGSGDIGTGVTPAPGVAPGPLRVNLAQAVSSLGLPTATLDELAQLQLQVGVSSARAAQDAPAAATGDYSIAGTQLQFQSPTLGAVVTAIDDEVATVQDAVNGLTGDGGVLGTALEALPLGGLVDADVTVTAADLDAAVAPLLAGPITDPAYPGVALDLSTGTVTVDLGAITGLEDLDPGTELLSAPVIAEIGDCITGTLGSLLTRVTDTLGSVTDALAVDADVTLAGLPVIAIDSTVGDLLDGDDAGIVLLGLIPIGTGAVLGALTGALGDLGSAISAVGPAVLAPVVSALIPALDPVLSGVLSLTANNQETAGGVFTETALRATVLPAADALVLNVATASVGPNALAGPPTIASLTPTSGPEAGGTAVTITGTGLLGATGATFDGIPGTAFTVVDDTTATVVTPAHPAGAVDVVLLDPAGDSAPGAFIYLAAPAIADIVPNEGPASGGTAVTITGSGFTGAAAVTFGGTPAAAFTVVDDGTITATTPAHAPGAVDVVVTTAGGDAAPGDFTFLPAVTGVAPGTGPETGGTAITITGSGFTGATGVTVGGTPATAVTVVDDGTITAITPAGTPGTADVVVQHPAGASLPGDFAYLAVPAVTTVTPNQGPETGGTPVTITGSGFTGATGVTFGGIPGVGFTVVDDGTITVASPAQAPGAVDVVVQHPVADSVPGLFTYLAVPSIAGITPDHGPETGGTPVTITGSGFTGATGVTFDGTAGTGFTVVDDGTISVTTPAGTAGIADVVVEHPVADSAPGTFTYDPVPAVAAITPDRGPQTGGTVMTITGSGFTGATGVTFEGVPGTGFTVIDDGTITVTTPAGAPGTAEVVVEHPNGDSLPGDFTYEVVPGAPVITGLIPDHGPYTGGTAVTITGTGFTGATGLTVDAAAVPFTVVDDGTITITTPAHAPGAVPVVVTTPIGPSPAATFTFDPGTTVDGVDPSHGPETGGTTVTIAGGCFTGATGVLFGSTPATSFTVIDDATITAVSPAGAGTVDVTVIGAAACGDATLAGGFRYDDPALAGTGSGSATIAAGTTGGGLASTGSDTSGASLLAGLAVLLIVSGAAVVVRRRRTA